MWIRLACEPKVLFGFCYIPPDDLRYFDPTMFSIIQEKVKLASECKRVKILGDLNARFRAMVRDLPRRAEVLDASVYQYPWIPDPVLYLSDNALMKVW